MDAATRGQWIERSASGVPQLRMFCFPYAGGGPRSYREWAHRLGPNVEICAILLPGRGRRLSQAALRRADEAAEILVEVMKPHLDLPFVLFGHSMGAILAYEVARGLLSEAEVEPRGLFVSGCRAPHLPLRRRIMHSLPRDELIAEIKAFNGTPAEVFEHADLLDLVLPTLRSDFELVETYAPRKGPVLSCPVLAMSGSEDDEVLPDELAGWRSVTTGPFKTMLFEGHHFYIHDAQTNFLIALRRELAALAER